MKKLLTFMAATLVAVSAFGGNPKTRSFLNCRALVVTNTINVTNLQSVIAGTRVTNMLYTEFTNWNGQKIVVTNGYNDYLNLLQTVPLFTDENSSYRVPIYTNQAPGLAEMQGAYNAVLYIRLVGLSGANSAVTFEFAPVPSSYDSSINDYNPNIFGPDDNASGDIVSVAITATTTTEVRSLTPLDMRKFYGCRGIMLRTIRNADTDASSSVTVLECTLNGTAP